MLTGTARVCNVRVLSPPPPLPSLVTITHASSPRERRHLAGSTGQSRCNRYFRFVSRDAKTHTHTHILCTKYVLCRHTHPSAAAPTAVSRHRFLTYDHNYRPGSSFENIINIATLIFFSLRFIVHASVSSMSFNAHASSHVFSAAIFLLTVKQYYYHYRDFSSSFIVF